jgi:hypothetical protein
MKYFITLLILLSVSACALGPPKWRADGYNSPTATCYSRHNKYAPSHMPDTTTYCYEDDQD